jgi:hypothetical protein
MFSLKLALSHSSQMQTTIKRAKLSLLEPLSPQTLKIRIDLTKAFKIQRISTTWVLHAGPNVQECSKALQKCSKTPKLHQKLETPPKHLRSDPALSKHLLSRSPTSQAKWAHNLLGNERRKQRDQRRKVEHNTQGLHTMERVISSSPYAFIYMCRLGPALTSQWDKVNDGTKSTSNLTLPSNIPHSKHLSQILCNYKQL